MWSHTQRPTWGFVGAAVGALVARTTKVSLSVMPSELMLPEEPIKPLESLQEAIGNMPFEQAFLGPVPSTFSTMSSLALPPHTLAIWLLMFETCKLVGAVMNWDGGCVVSPMQ
jgi:hypothetical protein